MSLQQLAQTVQSRGRNGDSVLIHMTPGEVHGLQQLAMSAGGSLTINPDTGLPEANFLKRLLPTLLGAGLSFIPGVGPLMAAGIVGGGTALASGDLRKGLMAGLGAYGGAGLASGLAGAGVGAAQSAAAAGVPTAAAGVAPAGIAGMPAFDPIAGAMINTPEALAQQAAMAQSNAAIEATRRFMSPEVSAEMGRNMAVPSTQTVTQMPVLDRVGAGIKALGTESGRSAALQSMGGTKQALRYGLAAAAPMMAVETQQTQREEEDPYLYQFSRQRYDTPYSSGPETSERQYFSDGTLTRLAEGGDVETKPEMSGASREIYDYLMGRTPVSPGTLRAQAQQAAQPAAPVVPTSAPKASSGLASLSRLLGRDDASSMFNYDPATGRLIAIAPAEPAARMGSNERMAGSGFGDSSISGGKGFVGFHGQQRFSKGGLAGLAKGGFVVPADVVSMLGEGSTDAGIRALKAKFGSVESIKGPGTGQSDSIPTTIEGRQRARVADGEAYIPPEVVQKHGGAKKFYAMLDRVRTASQGHTKQQRRINPKQVMA